jgi:hypothetical protein
VIWASLQKGLAACNNLDGLVGQKRLRMHLKWETKVGFVHPSLIGRKMSRRFEGITIEPTSAGLNQDAGKHRGKKLAANVLAGNPAMAVHLTLGLALKAAGLSVRRHLASLSPAQQMRACQRHPRYGLLTSDDVMIWQMAGKMAGVAS